MQDGQISPYAVLFSAAFQIWMLVDAWKRRAPLHWYFIIVLMPFGAVFYLVMVKLRDLRLGASARSPSMGNLRDTGPLDPTEARPESPDLDRADALEENERYLEAEPIYRGALTQNNDDKRAILGLARCLAGSGRAAESLAHFERLLEMDREYAGYGAALDYADALWAADQKNDTIELLESLAKMTGRINHRLALAHYLAEFGRTEHAINELEDALKAATAPDAPFSDRHRRWIEMGQAMLEDLAARSRADRQVPPEEDE